LAHFEENFEEYLCVLTLQGAGRLSHSDMHSCEILKSPLGFF